MKTESILLLCISGASACSDNDLKVVTTDAGVIIKYVNQCDGGTSPADLLPPPPACAAATGLGGTNLFCVDFSKTTIPQLTGWTFPNCTTATSNKWDIVNNQLQVNYTMFTGFQGTCDFTIPLPSTNNYTNYMISIVHSLSLFDGTAGGVAPQQAQLLGGTNLLSSMTGKLGPQPVQTIQVVPKTSVASPATFRLQAQTVAGSGFSGWRIESIAINGITP